MSADVYTWMGGHTDMIDMGKCRQMQDNATELVTMALSAVEKGNTAYALIMLSRAYAEVGKLFNLVALEGPNQPPTKEDAPAKA